LIGGTTVVKAHSASSFAGGAVAAKIQPSQKMRVSLKIHVIVHWEGKSNS